MIESSLTLDEWLRLAQDSAKRRGLPELTPLLAGLAEALQKVRNAHAALQQAPMAPAAEAPRLSTSTHSIEP